MESIVLDGQRYAFNRSGDGPVSVVLETGLGAESADWAPVEAEIAKIATVFRYDRIGRGESDKATQPRDAAAMVTALRALLDTVGVPGPYLMVGHSFGGLLGQLFAQTFRFDTRGLVLAESVHPAQFESLGSAFPPAADNDPPPLTGMRQFWTEGWKDPDATPEKIDFASSLAQARAVTSLDGLPLRVLTTGSFLHAPFLPLTHRQELQTRWEVLQGQLVRLSATAVQTRWPASGHFIQRDNPHAVVAAIHDLIAATAAAA